MDIPQLKLLAGRVRGLLQAAENPIGHNQCLDIVAAIPGLRNWPEVLAFPARVSACELDLAASGRLAFRLQKKFGLAYSSADLLTAISPTATRAKAGTPHIWPTGPAPGVYITTSQDAINALLEHYEGATDGELVYAERAGNHWEGSIDLGEDGLWSSGLPRVASGMLLVVGPVRLNQQEWIDGCSRLSRAAMCAYEYGHRVAVLMETPAPELLLDHVMLMVESTQPEGAHHVDALIGIVTENGELQSCLPFAGNGSAAGTGSVRRPATTDAVPTALLSTLRSALQKRKTGLVLVGSESNTDNPAIELVEAILAMSEHAGPAARIMPRHRSTSAKYWQVPGAIADLPFLPSIEAAYQQGYKRMVIEPGYTDGELLHELADDVLFIGGTYSSDVGEIFSHSVRTRGRFDESELVPFLLAILGVKRTVGEQQSSVQFASDLYLPTAELPRVESLRGERYWDYLKENRVNRWEEDMRKILDSGSLTNEGAATAFGRSRGIKEFLAERGKEIA